MLHCSVYSVSKESWAIKRDWDREDGRAHRNPLSTHLGAIQDFQDFQAFQGISASGVNTFFVVDLTSLHLPLVHAIERLAGNPFKAETEIRAERTNLESLHNRGKPDRMSVSQCYSSDPPFPHRVPSPTMCFLAGTLIPHGCAYVRRCASLCPGHFDPARSSNTTPTSFTSSGSHD